VCPRCCDSLGVGRALGLLPGVRRDRAVPSRLLIDRRFVGLYPLGVFQLLGYRRARPGKDGLVVEGKS
jgi:hypothetical protein